METGLAPRRLNARGATGSAAFVAVETIVIHRSAPFKCGTLVPVSVTFEFPLFTNGSGAIPLGWANWTGGLSGLSLYFQYAIQDSFAVCGVSLSNAMRADVP